MSLPQPLSGIRVLDLSRLLPGPYCTFLLRELGAAIDKVEDPGAGDYLRHFPPLSQETGMSGRFSAINRGKRSLCLDLKSQAGRAILLRLLPRYDVVVESFRPGVLERLGLGYKTLADVHKGIVLCSISGYGKDGPYKDRAGHDLNYLALAGVLGLCGTDPQCPPHPLPIQLADLGGGALYAALGIVAALYAAKASGQGRHLDISMCEGALSFLIPDLGNVAASKESPKRGGDLLTGAMACYGVYQTKDGKYLSVAALEPKFWMTLNKTLLRNGKVEELLAPKEDQERIRNELQAIFLEKTQLEWCEIFGTQTQDGCVEPVLLPDEVQEHPLHRSRSLFAEAGAVIRTPLSLRGGEESALPPSQGQHSEEILLEAGFSSAEIKAAQSACVIR